MRSGASSTHGVPGAPSAPSFCSVPPQTLPPTPAAAGSAQGTATNPCSCRQLSGPAGMGCHRGRNAAATGQGTKGDVPAVKPPQGSRQQGTRGALRRDLKSKYVWGKNAKGLSSGCHGRYLLDAGTTKQICSAEPQHPARQTLPLKLCGKSV